MVGQNRMEMLLFTLSGKKQLYGLNVFKIHEIMPCPNLTVLPKLQKFIAGLASVRGHKMSVIDLAHAIGGRKTENYREQLLILTEYNRSLQGFLVSSVERIVDLGWNKIMPPPKKIGNNIYMTAVSEYEGRLVEIIDVEKILAEINPNATEVSEEAETLKEHVVKLLKPHAKVLVADDSKVALRQTSGAVESLGIDVIRVNNGREAFDVLREFSDQGKLDEIELVISDVEMPELDGYSLCAALRKDLMLKETYVILHTSLSGVFNESMLKRAGANDFIPKFNPDELTKAIVRGVEAIHSGIKPSEAIMHAAVKKSELYKQ